MICGSAYSSPHTAVHPCVQYINERAYDDVQLALIKYKMDFLGTFFSSSWNKERSPYTFILEKKNSSHVERSKPNSYPGVSAGSSWGSWELEKGREGILFSFKICIIPSSVLEKKPRSNSSSKNSLYTDSSQACSWICMACRLSWKKRRSLISLKFPVFCVVRSMLFSHGCGGC